MSSFDIIGRREYVSQLLELPDVLKRIVGEYTANDVVPRYRIPHCFSGPILGTVGNDVYWKRGDELMRNTHSLYITCKWVTSVNHIKESFVLISSKQRFHIYNLDTTEILWTIDGTYAIVHKEKVYYVDAVHQVQRYNVNNDNFTVVDHCAYALRKCCNTIVVFHQKSCNLLHEPFYYHKADLITIFEYDLKRYYVYQTFVLGGEFSSITLPHPVLKTVGFDGYIVIACSDQTYFVLDLKRWQLTPIESFCFINDSIYKINDGFIEVF